MVTTVSCGRILGGSWLRSVSEPPARARDKIFQIDLIEPPTWVPEGSLAGFLGCIFEIWPAPGGPGRPSKMWGATPPHIFEGFPGPPGPARPQNAPNKFGQTAFRYPADQSFWVFAGPSPGSQRAKTYRYFPAGPTRQILYEMTVSAGPRVPVPVYIMLRNSASGP